MNHALKSDVLTPTPEREFSGFPKSVSVDSAIPRPISSEGLLANLTKLTERDPAKLGSGRQKIFCCSARSRIFRRISGVLSARNDLAYPEWRSRERPKPVPGLWAGGCSGRQTGDGDGAIDPAAAAWEVRHKRSVEYEGVRRLAHSSNLAWVAGLFESGMGAKSVCCANNA